MKDDGYYNNTMDFWLQKAILDIERNYNDQVSIAEKGKDLLKFGRNINVGTSRATIMTLPTGVLNETYVSDNLITTLSSSSASDTESLIVEGHTVDGNGDFTFVVQSITLTGQTQATLGTPLARCTRMYNNGTNDLVGTIYAYEDDTSTAGVPDTSSKVHTMIRAGLNQTEKASTTISKDDYWIVLDFDADCYDKAAAAAEVRLEVREKGGVFLPLEVLAVGDGSHVAQKFTPYKIIKPNSDIRLTSVADGANTDVGGMIQGVLAKIL